MLAGLERTAKSEEKPLDLVPPPDSHFRPEAAPHWRRYSAFRTMLISSFVLARTVRIWV